MLQSTEQMADVPSIHALYKPKQDDKAKTKKRPPLFQDSDLTAFLKDLQDKVEAIEEENEKLKEKIEDIKPIIIENINYKIQELTVKDLSGALNIGMTALTDPENIQQLMNEQGEMQFNDMDTEDMQMEEMNDFENEEPENKG
ncbi:spore germination protein GerPC [Alkalihalobacterium alkalicellulosilyticum]|uniref:spore germination protein GerPC n=1 Tax=Alkalihalobacterium alkalicellulosilyticum TaxID=1912214 RepID=UPI00099761F1|nr:spore germination protein GerPC [Bacillus alkalicellulosilyticus]